MHTEAVQQTNKSRTTQIRDEVEKPTSCLLHGAVSSIPRPTGQYWYYRASTSTVGAVLVLMLVLQVQY
jgi:hypothetical protein